MYNVKSTSTKHSLALYAKGDPTTLFRRYSLIVINPHGHYTINASLTSGVYRGFKFGLKGTYKVIFATPAKKYRMAPFISYRKDPENRIFGTSNIEIPSGDFDQIDDTNNRDMFTTGNPYGKLLRPSWGITTIGTKAKKVTVKELYNQFNDNKNESAVYSMRSYAAGDKIIVSDTITGLNYSSETDSTKLYFGSVNTYLEYKGNLTNKLKVGDHFKKEMKVEELGNNLMFRVPDYYK